MLAKPATFDRVMDRILFVSPDAAVLEATSARTAQDALSFSLLFSGIRCILQYAVLPFVLPVIGIAADATIPILLLINVIAVVSIVFSLRRFWRIRYDHRWTYFAVAMVALLLLGVFSWMDIQTLNTLTTI